MTIIASLFAVVAEMIVASASGFLLGWMLGILTIPAALVLAIAWAIFKGSR